MTVVTRALPSWLRSLARRFRSTRGRQLGHELKQAAELDGPNGMGHHLTVRTWSSDWTRTLSYCSTCSLCRQKMLEAGVVLLIENEVDARLGGCGDDDQPTW